MAVENQASDKNQGHNEPDRNESDDRNESGAKNGGKPRIIIVGAGFAGISAVRALRGLDADVLLIDRDLYTTFQPLLYQVATGGLNPGDVTHSLRSFTSRMKNTRFFHGKVTGVNPDQRTVQTSAGATFSYDYLIIATGVGANFFGITGAEDHAITIYSRASSVRVRDKVMGSLEAVAQKSPGAPEPVIVVVGGGATGVEMAGALAELRNAALPRAYPEIDPSRVRVILVEMMDDVLGPFAPPLRKYAAKALAKRGVELRLGTSVTEVTASSVKLGDETVPMAVTVWATGVKAPDVVGNWGLKQGKAGRLEVQQDLRVSQYPEIFVVGDVSAVAGQNLPQLAQPAMQTGKHAAQQIRRLLAGLATEPFVYHDKGTMATIGRSDAVVELRGGLKLRGFIAWIAWLVLHIFELMGNRNRVATLANLSVRYMTWKRSPNVIVGDPP